MDNINLLIGLITIIVLAVYFIKKRYSFWKDLDAPYVEPSIPLGNLKGVGRKEHTKDRLQKYYKQYKGKYPFVGLFFFFKPVALLLDIDLIKHVLIKDFQNFNDRGVYYNEKNDPVSAHLFSIHGPKWKLLRTKLTPTFTGGKMKFMFSTIVDVSYRMEKKLEDLIKTPNETVELEIKDILARFTTDVIGSCAFGLECNTLNDKNADFRKMGVRIFDDPKFGFVTNLFLVSIRSLAQKLGVTALHSDVSAFVRKFVTETIRYRNENNVHRNDFLDILIELQKNPPSGTEAITINEILAQSFVFFGAGFETSSTLLTFCLYELAKNQDIQQRLREHIEEVLAEKSDGKLTYEVTTEMKYLDQVLNETLRLYSPVSTLTRFAENDYKVPGTKYVFKRGVLIAIPVHAIHMDEEYYPNPHQFNPEHFSEETLRKRSPITHLPFGEGPRNCIGLRFGMMQARVGLIAALRKFNYSLSDKIEHPIKINKNRFITSPEQGMWLKVTRIT